MKRFILGILILAVQFGTVESQTLPSVAQAECFVDTDPGQGNGTQLTSDDGSLNEAFESATGLLSTGSLSLGTHTLFVRVRNSDGSWGQVYQKPILVNSSGATSVPTPPKLSQAEFFVDTDPGQGNGFALAASDGSIDEYFENVTAVHGTGSYGLGLHTLFVRVRSSDGTWGSAYTQTFQVLASGVSTVVVPPKISQAEFFVDTDPGPGNGFALAAADGGLDEYFEEASGSVGSGGYGLGLHTLSVRFRNSDGTWGSITSRAIRVNSSGTDFVAPVPKIAQGECFVDTDPGVGNGTALTSIDGGLDEVFEEASGTLATGSLSLGLHTLFVRFRDDAGVWGAPYLRPIDVTVAGSKFVDAGSRLSQAECFVDADPGQGNGFAMSGVDGSLDEHFDDAIAFFPTGSLSLGTHTLQVRLRGSDGNWGPVFSRTILVTSSGTNLVTVPPKIATAEYYINTDPGAGNGIPLTADDGGFDEWYENVSTTLSTSSMPEGVYAFGVRFRDQDGTWGSTFRSVFEIQNITPPSAPQNLMALAGDSSITLSWNANPEGDVMLYRIYAGPSPNPTTVVDSAVGGVGDTSRTLTGLVNGTAYYIRITAVDVAFLESPFSNEVSSTPVNINPPAPPQNVSGLSGNGQVTLRWNQNHENDFLRYRIYGATSANPTIQIDSVAAVGDTSRVLGGLTNGVTYYYRLTAVDVAGNASAYSNEVAVTPGDVTPPAIPQNLTAIAGDSSITLTWRANSESDFLMYRIFGGVTPSPTTLLDSSMSLGDTTSILSGLANGTTYYFRITAVDNALNQSDYSNEVSSAPVNLNPPAPPQNLSGQSGDGQVTLTWNQNREGDFLRYRIFGGTSANPIVQMDSATTAADTSRIIPGLSNGTQYYFRLTAVDAVLNQSTYSNEIVVTPGDVLPPAAPQNLTGLAGDSMVTLRWRRNSESDFLRYRIFGGLSPNPTTMLDSNSSVLDTVSVLSGLANGTTYYFRITAVDNALNQSGYSNEVSSAPVNLNPPAPPQNLSGQSGDGQIALTWNQNREGDFLRYRIYGGTSPTPFTVMDSTSGGSPDTTRTLSGLQNGTAYYFRITAVDGGLLESDYSNEITLAPGGDTPPAVPQNLAASPADSQVALTWDANTDPDFLRYRIYGGTSPNPSAMLDSVDGINTTSLVVSGLSNGIGYYFRMTAVDQGGLESGFSNEVQSTPININPPAIPVLLSAIAGDGSVTLTWSGNREGDFLRYLIFAGTTPNPTTVVDSSGTDTTKSVSGLPNYVTHYFRLQAIDNGYLSGGFSNQLTATPIGVNQNPNSFSLKFPANESLINSVSPTLQWEDRGDPDFQAVTYTVDVATDGAFSTIVRSQTLTDSAWTVVPALTEGAYYWRVTASDGFGGQTVSGPRFFRLDATAPTVTAGLFQSPVITQYLRVYVWSDEFTQPVSSKYVVRNAAGVNVDSASLAMTPVRSGTRLQSDDIHLIQAGTLIVTVSVRDSAGNIGTIVRNYAVIAMFKETALAYIDGDLSIRADRHAMTGNGFLILSRPEEGLAKTAGNSDELMRIELLSTEPLQANLQLTFQYGNEALTASRFVHQDFDERKVGVYVLEDSDWLYVGGEGANGQVRAASRRMGTITVRYEPTHEPLPVRTELAQNYPNPFNPTTTIRFGLQEESVVSLIVYNILGQQVRRLVAGRKIAGYHTAVWDSRSDKGERVASGVYFVRLETSQSVWTRRMILMK